MAEADSKHANKDDAIVSQLLRDVRTEATRTPPLLSDVDVLHQQALVQQLYMKCEHARQSAAAAKYTRLKKRASLVETEAIAYRDMASRQSIMDLRRRMQRGAQVRALWKRIEATVTAQPSPFFAPTPRALWMIDGTEDPTRRHPKLTHCPWLQRG